MNQIENHSYIKVLRLRQKVPFYKFEYVIYGVNDLNRQSNREFSALFLSVKFISYKLTSQSFINKTKENPLFYENFNDTFHSIPDKPLTIHKNKNQSSFKFHSSEDERANKRKIT